MTATLTPLARALSRAAIDFVPRPSILNGIPNVVIEENVQADPAYGVNHAMTLIPQDERGVQVLLQPWSSIGTNDTIVIHWGDTAVRVASPTEEEKNGSFIRIVPISVVAPLPGESFYTAKVIVDVTRPLGNVDPTDPIWVLVKLTLPGGIDTGPGTPGHQGLGVPEIHPSPLINAGNLGEGVTVTIPPYEYMRVRDTITVSWGGLVGNTHTVTEVEVGTPIVLAISADIVSRRDGDIEVAWKVVDEVNNQSTDSNDLPWSPTSSVLVEVGTQLLTPPYLPDYADDRIDLAVLGNGDAVVGLYPSSPAFLINDEVRMHCRGFTTNGDVVEFAQVQRVLQVNRPMELHTLPNSVLKSLKESTALVYYENSRTNARSKSLLISVYGVAAKLPAPVVREGIGGPIPPTTSPAHVDITFTAGTFQLNDTVAVHWTGTGGTVPINFTSTETVSQAELNAGLITRDVDNLYVHPLAGRNVTVYYTVNGGEPSELYVQAVDDVGADPIFPAPNVIGAPLPGLELNPIDAINGAVVTVSYDTMVTSDSIHLYWVGPAGAGTPAAQTKPGDTSKTVSFTVPASVIGASVNRRVRVYYTVTRSGTVYDSGDRFINVLPVPVLDMPAPWIQPPYPDTVLTVDELSANATVHLPPWVFIAPNQHVWLQLEGIAQGGGGLTIPLLTNRAVTAGEVSTGVDASVTIGQLAPLATGSTLKVVAKVTFDGQAGSNESDAVPFQLYGVTIARGLVNPGSVNVPQAYIKNGNQQRLSMSDFYREDFLSVELLLDPSVRGTDYYWLTWLGVGGITWRSSRQLVNQVGVKTVFVPRAEIIDVIGSTATLTCSVERNGVTYTSAPLYLSVDQQDLVLQAPTISGRVVTVRYDGWSTAHTARVRCIGTTTWDHPDPQPHMANGSCMTTIDSVWYQQNVGREVLINYTIYRGANNPTLLFSRLLRVTLRPLS